MSGGHGRVTAQEREARTGAPGMEEPKVGREHSRGPTSLPEARAPQHGCRQAAPFNALRVRPDSTREEAEPRKRCKGTPANLQL